MSSILIRTAVVVLLLAVLGFGTGLAFGAIWGWSFFSLGLVGLLLHHVRHLNLLRRWASSSLTEAVPEGSGAWEEVFTLLYRRQRAETARRDFVANVSHELRTPLTVLVGFLETVRELKLDPERSRDYLNLMAEQSRRMQRIIDDLLTLSTLESAPEPPHDEQVDVGSLLSRIHGEAQALSAGRQRLTLDPE